MTVLPNPADLDDVALGRLIRQVTKQDRYDWKSIRRKTQTPPDWYLNWIVMAGRGFGKTRTASEALREKCEQRAHHIAVIHRKQTDVRDICFEHRRSGLLTVIPDDLIVEYKTPNGYPMLRLKNGTVFRSFSAQEPDSIRGFEFDGFWGDEYASWNKHTAQDMFDQAWFCLRESPQPFAIITTTPKRLPHVVEIANRAGLAKGATPRHGYVGTRGHTLENRANLSEPALAELSATYDGTRLGRQELGGELLEDVENALWTLELVESCRLERPLPDLVQTVTAVDPSGSEDGDATGIVTSGVDQNGTVYILADDTTKGTPEHRYERACLAAARWGSGVIYYESAYGGDNVAAALRSAWEHLRNQERVEGLTPMLKPTKEKGSKADRASPVVGLFEQHANGTERVYLSVPFPEMEDEMTTWEVDSDWSPNRIDAMVYSVRFLTARLGRESEGRVGWDMANEVIG